MDVIMVGSCRMLPSQNGLDHGRHHLFWAPSQNGLDHGRHHAWAMHALFSDQKGLDHGHHHGWAMDALLTTHRNTLAPRNSTCPDKGSAETAVYASVVYDGRSTHLARERADGGYNEESLEMI